MDTEELLQELREKLERLATLEAAFAGTNVSTTPRRTRRRMSASARRRISEAQTRRWAAVHAAARQPRRRGRPRIQPVIESTRQVRTDD